MFARFLLTIIFATLMSDHLPAQDYNARDSSGSAFGSDSLPAIPVQEINQERTPPSACQTHGFEINLSIEEKISDRIIGDFFLENQYNLVFNLDSSTAKEKEFVAEMRARRSFKQVINIDYSKVPPGQYPFIIQFNSNIFTGFKPIKPLISFGF